MCSDLDVDFQDMCESFSAKSVIMRLSSVPPWDSVQRVGKIYSITDLKAELVLRVSIHSFSHFLGPLHWQLHRNHFLCCYFLNFHLQFHIIFCFLSFVIQCIFFLFVSQALLCRFTNSVLIVRSDDIRRPNRFKIYVNSNYFI